MLAEQAENYLLRAELQQARSDMKAMETKLGQLEGLFDSSQLRRLYSRNNKTHWDLETIRRSMVVYMAGPSGYYIQLARGMPLPHPRTLRRSAVKLGINEGFLWSVLNWLRKVEGNSRYCTIAFDEMSVRKCFEYNATEDRIMGPYSKVQVVLVKSIIGKWKQVVYYKFDQPMTKSLLEEIIAHLEAVGLFPSAVVSDMDPTNVMCRKALLVDETQPSIITQGGNQLFFFGDPPHLLKRARDHLLDHGYKVGDQVANIEPIKKLVNLQSGSDLRLCPRLKASSIFLRGAKRQAVAPAAKLLSNSVASGIVHISKYTVMPDNTAATASLLKTFNDFFDMFNVSVPYGDSRITKRAFGVNLTEQLEKLNYLANEIGQLRSPPSKTVLQPFQKGMLLNIASLQGLHKYLTDVAGLSYILTRRIGQDDLESLFGIIRMRGGGGLHDHPSPYEFFSRLQNMMLGMLYNRVDHYVIINSKCVCIHFSPI